MDNGILQTVSLDAALPILHGKNGEDGTVQGLLELAGIPVVGCDLLSSAVCMNKEMAHRLVAAEGIAVPPVLFGPAPVQTENRFNKPQKRWAIPCL